VFADIINLGRSRWTNMSGYPNRNGATEAYWWTANFGITWQL
jgi:hypothetical protein